MTVISMTILVMVMTMLMKIFVMLTTSWTNLSLCQGYEREREGKALLDFLVCQLDEWQLGWQWWWRWRWQWGWGWCWLEESLVVFLVRVLNNQQPCRWRWGGWWWWWWLCWWEGVCSFPGSRARRLATDRKIPLNFFSAGHRWSLFGGYL